MLKEWRKKQGLHQREVGALIGCNQQMVSKLENKVASPGWRLAKRIAELLGVSIDAVYREYS